MPVDCSQAAAKPDTCQKFEVACTVTESRTHCSRLAEACPPRLIKLVYLENGGKNGNVVPNSLGARNIGLH